MSAFHHHIYMKAWTPELIFDHLYLADQDLTIDGGTGRGTRWQDQVGTIDWKDTVPTNGFVVNTSDALIGGLRSLTTPASGILSVDRSASDAAAGWVTTLPFTLVFLTRLGFTSGAPSELFRDTRGFGNGVQIFRQSNAATTLSSNKAEAAGSNDLALNGSGNTNINFNATTGVNLTTGQTTPYELIAFEFSTSAQRFLRNGSVIVTSGTPTSPRVYNGTQMTFANGSPSLTLPMFGVANKLFSSGEWASLRAWINNKYSTSF